MKAAFKREIGRLGSTWTYLVGMILIPLAVALFFVDLLDAGLPQRLPTSIVDLDHSTMSRQIRRTLDSNQFVNITDVAESYDEALEQVRKGQVYGFFVIPANFQADAVGGRKPTLEYYTNMTYFVSGTLAFKGFKSVAVTTSGGMLKTTLTAVGIPDNMAGGLLTPVIIDINPLNNPWMNYSAYMAPSYVMATFVLMIMLMTVYAITGEIKHGTSVRWLKANNGSVIRALFTKLLPHTVIYIAVAFGILWMFFCWQHFPLNGSLAWVLTATVLLVVASQAFAVIVCSLIPNPRFAYSMCALFGVLTYSFGGFSFPVENMYGAVAIFSWFAPVRYWYLIYINEALNGVALFYSRWFFAALLIFPLLSLIPVLRLKKALLNPVYVP